MTRQSAAGPPPLGFSLGCAPFSFYTPPIRCWERRTRGSSISGQFRSTPVLEALGPAKEGESWLAASEGSTWQDDLVKELDPLARSSPRPLRARRKGRTPSHILTQELCLADWAERARQRALLAVRSRGSFLREDSRPCRAKAKKKGPVYGGSAIGRKNDFSGSDSAWRDCFPSKEDAKKNGPIGEEREIGKKNAFSKANSVEVDSFLEKKDAKKKGAIDGERAAGKMMANSTGLESFLRLEDAKKIKPTDGKRAAGKKNAFYRANSVDMESSQSPENSKRNNLKGKDSDFEMSLQEGNYAKQVSSMVASSFVNGLGEECNFDETSREGNNVEESIIALLPIDSFLGRKKHDFNKSLLEANDVKDAPNTVALPLMNGLGRKERGFKSKLNHAEEVPRIVSQDLNKCFGRKKYNFDKSFQEANDAAKVRSMPASSLSSGLRREVRDFNKSLQVANDAEEVLNMVRSAMKEARFSGLPSVLSSFNIATALHRIARHMENSCMLKTSRLAFARQREMAELVSGAMILLSSCSTQGLANIAWALAKVGGSSLYSSEMDHIAVIAMSRVEQFSAHNIANIAGAYASMQHSATSLFAKFNICAACIAESFRIQELAQLLWAFASLYQPPTLLLDALDNLCLSMNQEKKTIDSVNPEIRLSGLISVDAKSTDNESFIDFPDFRKPYGQLHPVGKNIISEQRNEQKGKKEIHGLFIKALFTKHFAKDMKNLDKPLKNAPIGQLANIVWSYAVLNELDRPSFTHIWQTLVSLVSSTDRWMDTDDHIHHIFQIYQTNLSLQLEYPHTGFALSGSLKEAVTQIWDRQKASLLSKSVPQKEIKRLLVSTGYNWVVEYTGTYYSLDIALVEKKIGIEIDGPSHFTRNTGAPLGHTILKRRLMTKAGWTLLSVPFQEWEDLDGESEHMEFIRNLLGVHL